MIQLMPRSAFLKKDRKSLGKVVISDFDGDGVGERPMFVGGDLLNKDHSTQYGT